MHPEDFQRPTDYVSVQEAADHFGFGPWLIYRAVKRGQLKSYRFCNSRILVRISDIEALLEASVSGGTDG